MQKLVHDAAVILQNIVERMLVEFHRIQDCKGVVETNITQALAAEELPANKEVLLLLLLEAGVHYDESELHGPHRSDFRDGALNHDQNLIVIKYWIVTIDELASDLCGEDDSVIVHVVTVVVELLVPKLKVIRFVSVDVILILIVEPDDF